MMRGTPPEFVIVGAAKAGTTSVHEYLDEHPDVFMTSPKETNFFYLQAIANRPEVQWGSVRWELADRIETPAQYLALFRAAAPGQVRGEASPSYMSDERVPGLLKQWNPSVRVLMLLRDPAERAWSEFLHNQRDATEPMPIDRFREAFEDGPRRTAEGWDPHCIYDGRGRYATILAQWLTVFPREQVGVFFYDDLRRDPRAFMRAIFAFIGVDPSFEPDTATRYNVTGIPRNRRLHRLVSHPHPLKRMFRWLLPPEVRRRLRYRLMQRNLAAPPALPAETREFLARHYLQETERLEVLAGRDLSAWKPGGKA